MTVSENGAGFARESGFEKKKRFQGKPAHAGQPQFANASSAKPAFGKKAKKNRGG
jgi:ATP-dependent RNA helicase DeaD